MWIQKWYELYFFYLKIQINKLNNFFVADKE